MVPMHGGKKETAETSIQSKTKQYLPDAESFSRQYSQTMSV